MTALAPMARDLGDLELILRLLAGPDGQGADVPPVPIPASTRYALEGLRLAVAPTLPGIPVEASIRGRVDEVSARAADAGARVVASLPDLDWGSLHALFLDLVMTITTLFDPDATLREEQRTLAWYFEALERRDRFVAIWESFFQDHDALLLPAAPMAAFTHRESGAPVVVDGEEVDYWTIPGLVTFCNLVGLPALVVPAGTDGQGLPIGVQIVGPRWSEMRLLDLARALEEAGVLPGFRAPPPLNNEPVNQS
jgi:amidase